MTGAITMQDVLRATVHADGRLLSADPPLATLQRHAGGSVDGPLAVPQLAALARLALRLNIPLSRPVIAAGPSSDIDMWVRAQPRGEQIDLTIIEWRERPAQTAVPEDKGRSADLLASGDGWWWQIDAQLRFVVVDADDAGSDDAMLPKVGSRLAGWFRIAADTDGDLPILRAFAERRPFNGQRATGPDETPCLLSGMPMFDAHGRLTGYRCRTQPVVQYKTPDRTDDAPGLSLPMFGRRLDRALRQPLGRIIANAETISSQREGPLRPDYAGYAADIASAGRHLMALVDDLADLQAIDRPDFTVTIEDVDLADLARRAAGLLGVKAADRRIRLDAPDEHEHLMARGEFRRVLQVLVNLIGNAVRYGPEGSMVWIRVDQSDDGRANVTVADQGNGIAPEDHERIFDKFERLGRDEAGGSGLGLYISRRLARAMDGDIRVDSAPGQGARFVLTLPAA
ncbi:sensor histidine kinase [Sphingobium algorifonticola]|nr:HAMP domain-containing sensor histidine kinase [Sphingobium algorifonticola]